MQFFCSMAGRSGTKAGRTTWVFSDAFNGGLPGEVGAEGYLISGENITVERISGFEKIVVKSKFYRQYAARVGETKS
jgi:hypothetical protein